ncbi:MAG TPA: hypothetical protein VMX11_02790 [Actinomycetes bacterium]|nr:hypothetical protein [Actinomycetes bacterium]
MNKAFRTHLTDGEIDLIESTKPANLSGLDEDALGDRHDRVRTASRKYRKLHRRQASHQVRRDGSRAAASAKNQRSGVKTEVFEDALARVSRALSRAAKESAAELKAERLAAATSASSRRPASTTRSQGPSGAGRKPAKKRTRANKKKNASTLASGARRQAKRDARWAVSEQATARQISIRSRRVASE